MPEAGSRDRDKNLGTATCWVGGGEGVHESATMLTGQHSPPPVSPSPAPCSTHPALCPPLHLHCEVSNGLRP